MIDLIVNTPTKELVYEGLIKVGVQEAIQAAKLLHPDWTSLVITLVRQ